MSAAQRIRFRGHSPRTISNGRPTSSVNPRRAGVEARPYGVWLRGMTDCVISPHPRCTNPSVAAQSAATAPLSWEPRAWEEVCGVYASVSHDADTYVAQPPVRGGVPDAPRLRDRRAALDAAVRLDRQHPRHQRRARLASASPRIQSRGHSPRTFVTGAPTFSVNQRRARRFQRQIHLVRRRTASAARAHLPQALQGRV